MLLSRWTIALVAGFLLTCTAFGAEVKSPDPLFDSDDMMDVRIVAPMNTLIRERPDEEELPAKFQYTNSAGEAVELDIQIRAGASAARKKPARFHRCDSIFVCHKPGEPSFTSRTR